MTRINALLSGVSTIAIAIATAGGTGGILKVSGTLTKNATIAVPNNGKWGVVLNTTGAFSVTLMQQAPGDAP